MIYEFKQHYKNIASSRMNPMLFIYTKREPVSLELLRSAWYDVHVHVVLHYTAPSSFKGDLVVFLCDEGIGM